VRLHLPLPSHPAPHLLREGLHLLDDQVGTGDEGVVAGRQLDTACRTARVGLRSIGRPESATLVLAVIRGLLMDLDATGDTERTHRAFREFLDALDPG